MNSKNDNFFLNALKSVTEEKVNFTINNLGDCKLLSIIILESIDEYINYNTLRRIYGLVPDVKTRTKTLDKLARFNNYKNFPHFIQTFSYKDKLKITDRIYKIIYKTDEKELSKILVDIRKSADDVNGLLSLLIRELIYNKKFKELDILFKQKELRFESFRYSDVLDMGNSVGLIFRNEIFVDKILLENTNFLKIVFLIFVDYTNLNKYYGDWSLIINEKTDDEEIKMFTSAILQFKNYLNDLPVNYSFAETPFESNIHPVLCSRLLSVKIMANDYDNIDQLMEDYISKHNIKENKNIDYFLEIILNALISKNIETMAFIVTYFESEKYKFNTNYRSFYIHFYYLMCSIYYKVINEHELEKKYFKRYSSIEIRYSYEDITNVFYLIYKYSNEKTFVKKNKIKNEFFRLQKTLNYKKFSIDYLETYFKIF